jgi:hypothetical protein
MDGVDYLKLTAAERRAAVDALDSEDQAVRETAHYHGDALDFWPQFGSCKKSSELVDLVVARINFTREDAEMARQKAEYQQQANAEWAAKCAADPTFEAEMEEQARAWVAGVVL